MQEKFEHLLLKLNSINTHYFFLLVQNSTLVYIFFNSQVRNHLKS